MTVEQAIEELKKLPPKMKLYAMDDSSCTTRQVTGIYVENDPQSSDGSAMHEEEPVAMINTSC